jgi:hypothetical protein
MDTSLKTGICQCILDDNLRYNDYRCEMCEAEDELDELGQAECEHLEYLERIYAYAATEARTA